MFKEKNLTILLVVAVFALSYQTAALAVMSKKLDNAQIGVGNAPSAVNFTDDGSAPSMVGGC